MTVAKKYYWLKLRRDFFKRHDITIMGGQEDGDEYVLFYLKLLVESIDHEGYLRYSEEIPYTEEDLSSVTNTNSNVTRNAIEYFKQKKLMIWDDDGTIYLPKAVELIGSESDSAERVRRYRERNKGNESRVNTKGNTDVTKCNGDVTNSNTELELELELELDKEFSAFWSAYPRKVQKKTAKDTYLNLHKKKLLPKIEEHVRIIEQRKLTDQWKKDNGEFIPHPATWLNQERWNDEINSVEQEKPKTCIACGRTVVGKKQCPICGGDLK